MRIACLVASLSRKAGGVYESVRRLCQTLPSSPNTEVHVLGVADKHTQDDLPGWAPLPTHVFPVRGPHQFGYAPGLKKRLFDLDADVLLTHGLWMYPTVVTLAWHRHTRRPFILNPHGMLEPWSLSSSSYKKRLAGFLYENSTLRQAGCLRALCSSEARSIRAYGLSSPICVIPNGVDLPVDQTSATSPWDDGNMSGDKTLLYLGRIHPKKNLSALLQAWAVLRKKLSVQARDWNLVIAGWDQGGHELELKNLVERLGIDHEVHFSGPQFGPAKAAAYGHADAFILPSLSEGLPMTVLEAWAHRLPVIMTPECHLPEGFEKGAAIRTLPDAASIVAALETLFSMDPASRMRMGDCGRQLVAERFNWADIGSRMHQVCRWLLDQGEEPVSLLADHENYSLHESSFA